MIICNVFAPLQAKHYYGPEGRKLSGSIFQDRDLYTMLIISNLLGEKKTIFLPMTFYPQTDYLFQLNYISMAG